MLRKLKIHYLNNNTDPILDTLLIYLNNLFKNCKFEYISKYTIIRSLNDEFIVCYNDLDVNLNIKIIFSIEDICNVDSHEASDILEYYITNKISNTIIGEKNVYVCTTELINVYICK